MSRKRKKMTRAEIRVNLILLAIIVGVSATLIYGRFLLDPVGQAQPAAAAQPTVESIPVPVAPVVKDTPSASPMPLENTVPVQTVQVEKPAMPAMKAPAPAVKTPPPSPAVKTVQPAKKPPVTTAVPVPASVSAPPPERPVPVKKKGTLVFVFDDAGHNLSQLAPFLRLPFPCTIAVLPGLQYSRLAAQRIRAAGKEVILHQPMQALNLSIDPGPGALKKGMTADQIRATVRSNMTEVGPVTGMNNHEGSLITADRPSVDTLLDFVRENGIYFLDSRTNAETVVPALAREKKMTIWERAVFLDNIQDRTMIIEAVNTGMKIAERKGAAIMIGHIWSNDLASILTEMYPELVSQGFSLSTIAEIAVSGDADE